MKIISWNVNGIRAVEKKGFIDFVKKESPDILCLQEIKIHEVPQIIADKIHKLDYSDYWNFAKKPGYSGTAIFVKKSEASILKQVFNIDSKSKIYDTNFQILNTSIFGNEGRVVALEFDKFYLINAYFPHTRHDLSRKNFKLDFKA